MDGLLHTKDAQNLELDGGKVVQKIVKLYILSCRLDSFVDGDNQLVRLFYRKLSLCVHDGLHSRLDELLLKDIEVLKVIFLVHKVVLE
jgi:hypothetical protein